MKIRISLHSCGLVAFLDSNLEPQGFQPVDKMMTQDLLVTAVEVITAEFVETFVS